MSRLKDYMVPFITRQQIKKIVMSLAKQIESDYEGQEIVLICPLKGSVLFLADLMRFLTIPLQVDFVHLVSKGSIQILKDITTNIEGKHVLIVEEIIDSGRKLTFLKKRLQASNPKSVKVITFIDKPARREIAVNPDYVGTVVEDRFLIGYGLDSEEVGRNYPDIYILNN